MLLLGEKLWLVRVILNQWKNNNIKKLSEWPDRFNNWIERKKILRYMISLFIVKVYIKVGNLWKNTKTETWSWMIFFFIYICLEHSILVRILPSSAGCTYHIENTIQNKTWRKTESPRPACKPIKHDPSTLL